MELPVTLHHILNLSCEFWINCDALSCVQNAKDIALHCRRSFMGVSEEVLLVICPSKMVSRNTASRQPCYLSHHWISRHDVLCDMYQVILCHRDLIETGYTAPQVPLVTRRQFQHRLQTVSNVLQFFLCHRASLLRQLDGAVLYASIRLSQCSITDILLSTYRGSTLECNI